MNVGLTSKFQIGKVQNNCRYKMAKGAHLARSDRHGAEFQGTVRLHSL